ncbi:DUF1877 family protein [Pseudoblastomonas halimionae]|uniref:DUF1877 family protein n=1 Tax=Alteriqipengyuania halimionae TaxID=1926630 RepID=A0A6I4U5X3_9SPHN|nr:DUF1877 family protein [Alteriqipengyuania halimionae]MXP09852.1 DUF1877 family protein [Alteriqipengyuania halimionae]
MSMIWTARLANDDQVAAIKSEPESAGAFVNPESGSERELSEGAMVDLDQEWHGTHFMLTEAGEKYSKNLELIFGDFEAVGPDNGYGPVHYISADQIRRFHTEISSLTDKQIAAVYDTDKMVEQYVHLAEMFAEDGDEGRKFLMTRIGQLREFAKKGAENASHAFSAIS